MVNKTIKKDSTTVLAFLLTVMCLVTAQYSIASENGKQVFQKNVRVVIPLAAENWWGLIWRE